MFNRTADMATPFTIRTIQNCVAVVTFRDTPTLECWPQYEHSFRRLYDKYARFVIVFDVSGMGVPPFSLISKKKQLIIDLKSKTVKQVLANIVFTPHEIVRDVVVALVRAAGQSSPFYAYSDFPSTIETAARLVRLIKNIPPLIKPRADLLTWGDLSFNTRIAVITFSILQALPAIVAVFRRTIAA